MYIACASVVEAGTPSVWTQGYKKMVTGNFAVGNLSAGNFAVESFAVNKFRCKENWS